jgi:hypothetical protein
MNAMHARDCYQQAKTIHRLLLILADDLGDLSSYRDAPEEFGELWDEVSGTIEPALQAMREKLQKLTSAA